MTPLAIQLADARPLVRPEPRIAVSIRVAIPGADDFKFIDALQKKHSKAVGFLKRKALEARIAAQQVLIADNGTERLGYIVYHDRYFKREDVGIIYQLNVLPGKQRSLIGAALVKAAFERSAYGVKLYCCWCAQDLPANHFWESLGFVPLAFRTGSEKHQRIHIFWQKRIREGDAGPASGGTPWWFPSLTSGGAIREGRLVIPIPPGTHWSDAKPMVVPGVGQFAEENQPRLPGAGASRGSSTRRKPKMTPRITVEQKAISNRGGLWFAPTSEASKQGAAPGVAPGDEERPKRQVRHYHPKYVEAARELCARYLEGLHAGRFLPESMVQGKYDVRRSLAEGARRDHRVQIGGMDSLRLLEAA